MLKDFRERLQNLMPDEYMRPFACKGNPYECRIFIVGANPATRMEKPFIANYWSDCTGFLYCDFYRDYDAQKERRGNRLRYEQFVDGAIPIPCLETNIYATPSKSGESLPEGERDTALFEFLLRKIQPDAIFLFAKASIQYFESRFDCKLDGDSFETVDVFGHETHALRLRPDKKGHYEIFWRVSLDEASAIGERFKSHLT